MNETMLQRFSAEWVEARAAARGVTWLDHHACGGCGSMVGYQISPHGVWFASGCDCSWSPPRPSSFADIAHWLAMQSSDEIRDRIMEGLRAPEVPSAKEPTP